MNLKKRSIIFSTLLIVIIQILLYTNNSQKTSFRYFVWTLQDVSIGKLISISFFSGLFMSIFLNNINTASLNKKNIFYDQEENFVPQTTDEDDESNIEMPPQRDIRDTQPTISVNYRVIKNTKDNTQKYEQNFSNHSEYQDDWINDDKDW